ncbi:MAG: hypothetical protein JXX28_06515 [Deltaproteobacteria bacterium]|nr:hypothetical protein [Deltaproteobacteria bacterium]
MRTRWITALALMSACAHRVEVSVPPLPAVELATTEVAVVAGQRQCRAVADALAEALRNTPGVSVNPSAPVRLEVSLYEHFTAPQVSITEVGGERREGRVSMDGHAHALLTVTTPDGLQARLMGEANRSLHGELLALDLSSARQRLDRELTRGVALDLAEQVRPLPKQVERSLYPKASVDSAKGQLHQAVLAELAGDLDAARRHANLAQQLRPSPSTQAYLQELNRRARGAP